VRDYHPAEQLPLDEVRDQIRATLEQRKTREALAERAETIIADLEAGESPEGVGEWSSYEGLARNSSDVGPAILEQVFSLPRPADGARFGKAVTANSAAVIALDEVTDGQVAEESTELNQLREFLASLEGQREYAAYQQFLRNRAEVERP
ncbi:peptidylprolyl isomerase, partial [Marinobacter sp. B9-2]